MKTITMHQIREEQAQTAVSAILPAGFTQAASARSVHDQGCWKILVVDDDPILHDATEVALAGYDFMGRRLSFLHAYSASEAIGICATNPDIAILLLDMVMEHEDAGQMVIDYVRRHLKNNKIRIILRSGNMGQAPEKRLIADYDINDYRDKAEFTGIKLYTSVMSALRNYRDIAALDHSRQGMRLILDGSPELFSENSTSDFAHKLLQQTIGLLQLCGRSNIDQQNFDALFGRFEDGHIQPLAAMGRFAAMLEPTSHSMPSGYVPEFLAAGLADQIRRAEVKSGLVFFDQALVCLFKGHKGQQHLVYIENMGDPAKLDRDMFTLFHRTVAMALETVLLNQEIDETQRELVYRLGDALETRSYETGTHIRRVAQITRLIAEQIGVGAAECDMIANASTLHDVGKIAIPDAVLNKPTKYDENDWAIMRKHSQYGYQMLVSSDKPILQAGAIIALEHHEKWDGSGYPHGKKGKEIHLYGRIVAIADVLDALSNKRCYKDAWNINKIRDFVQEQSGHHFDPGLADIVVGQWGSFAALLEKTNETHQ